MQIKSLIVILLAAVAISSCANKSDEGSKNASTPLDANCANGTTACQNGVYNQYPYSMYNTSYGGGYGNNGWCGCPWGSLPVYNGVNGAGCIQQQYYYNNFYNGGFYFYFGSNWQPMAASYMNRTYWPNNNHWVNIPQTSGYQNYNAYNNASCAGRALRGCQVQVVNSCPTGYTCRQTGATNLGICVNY